EGAPRSPARLGEELDGKEEEREVGAQQHQSLAGLRAVEGEPGPVLNESEKKKQRQRYVERRPDEFERPLADGTHRPQEKREASHQPQGYAGPGDHPAKGQRRAEQSRDQQEARGG